MPLPELNIAGLLCLVLVIKVIVLKEKEERKQFHTIKWRKILGTLSSPFIHSKQFFLFYASNPKLYLD